MDIDPRGPRFGALITIVVFALVLITGSVWLLAAQAWSSRSAPPSACGTSPTG